MHEKEVSLVKHPIAIRSVSLLLALLMVLAIPASALEQAALAGGETGTADSDPFAVTESEEETEDSGETAQPGDQEETPSDAAPEEPEPVVYFNSDGSYRAPKRLTIYYVGLLDGTSPQDMMPEDHYTGVVAFFDYEEDEELEEPYFFYYEDGVLQDDEELTVQAASYLETTGLNTDTEDASYFVREVYVDEQAEEHPEFSFAFNREDGEENGIVTPEEPEDDNSLPDGSNSLLPGADNQLPAGEVDQTQPGEAAGDDTSDGTADQGRENVAVGADYPTPTTSARVEAGGVRVSWTGDDAATGYRVYRSTDGSSWTALSDLTGSSTSYLDSDAPSGQSYSYAVRAYYGELESEREEETDSSVWSDLAGSAAVYYLAAPELDEVYSAADGIVITWERVTGAERYTVWRKEPGDTKWTQLGTATGTSFTDKTAKVGETYWYTARAVSSSGTSDYYNLSTDRANLVVLHGTPEVTAVMAGAGSGIRVSWSRDAAATGYRVFRRSGSTWVVIARVSASTSSYVDANPTSGQDNYYTVRAYYGDEPIATAALNNENDWSPYQSSEACYYLAAPEATAYTSDSGVTVTWNAVSGAAGYRVYRKTSSTSWTMLARLSGSRTLSYVDKTAEVGGEYYYTVRAYRNSDGTVSGGYYVPEESIVCRPTLTTTAYTKVEGVQVNWTKDDEAKGYRVYRKTGSSAWTVVANLAGANYSGYLDKTAASGTQYVYTVRAYYGSRTLSASVGFDASTNEWSGTKNSATITFLTTPTLEEIYSDANGMRVNWTAVKGATGYQIYRKTATTNWQVLGRVTGANTTTYVDKTAAANGSYYYTVRAYYSNTATTNMSTYYTPEDPVVFHKALQISVVPVSGGLDLSWTRDSRANGYRLYRRVKGTSTWTVLSNITSNSTVKYRDQSLTNNTTYEYVVRAYYGSRTLSASVSVSNNNEWSGSLTESYVYLAAPELGRTENTTTGIKVTWEKVSGATGYRVYRKTPNGTWAQVAKISSGATEAYVDTSSTKLSVGTAVYYTVRAIGSDGVSLSFYDTTGLYTAYLPAPELVAAEVSSSGTTIKWNAVSTADKYRVYRRSENGSWTQLGEVTGTSYKDTQVKSDSTTYYYTVRSLRTDTVNGRSVTISGAYDTEGITFSIPVSGNGWITEDGKTYYGRNGYALTGWQYLSRNGGTYKYYFDPDTGELATNLYSYFGRSYRELDTKITVNLTNQSSNPGQVVIYVYNSETKAYDIPTASFRCVGSLTKTLSRGSSGYLRSGSGSRWEQLVPGGAYEQYCTYIRGTPSWFHSTLYNGASSYRYSASSYNSLIANRNTSNGCVRLQCIYAYLIIDIMKNGYGEDHRVSVQLYKNNSSKGPFGVPQVSRISTSRSSEPTDPAVTGKFFYATTAVGVSVSAGADDWCTY